MCKENLTVSVSGSTVYKAVSNYFKNSITFQDIIAEKVAIVLESGIVTTMVKRRFDEKFSGEIVIKEVQKEVQKQIKNYLNKEVIDKVMQDVIESMASKIKGKK